MSGINATYDRSLDPSTRDAIKSMIDAINTSLPTRSVNLNVTSNVSQLTAGNQLNALQAANYTSTVHVKNDTLFVNRSIDYSDLDATPLQSWMHELVHIAFPGIAGTIPGQEGREEYHEEEFYEKLAEISDIVGVKFSNSDLGKWKKQLAALGLQPDVIEAITEDYADKDPSHERHCFLADTPILMADGTHKPIQDIAPGDQVMAFDPTAHNGLGARKPARVTRTFRNTARQIIDLRGLRMTPGHVVLSDDGQWLRIADVLRQDRTLVEERADGPVRVRARTGALAGSDEDAPVTVVFADGRSVAHRAVVRAGIVCIAERRADGSREGWSLARVLRHQGYAIAADGGLTGSDGRVYEATPWPGGTPLDAVFQEDWVVSVDGQPYVPSWIAALRDGEERQAVNASPAASAAALSGLNRRERRRRAALRRL